MKRKKQYNSHTLKIKHVLLQKNVFDCSFIFSGANTRGWTYTLLETSQQKMTCDT